MKISPRNTRLTDSIKLLLYFLLLSSPIQFLLAQKITFENIDAKHGLSQSSVTSISQDSTGFLWFGTYDGLNRYDGYNFKVFKNDPESANSVSGNFIRCLLTDKSDHLWIGTHGNGLNLYNHETETFFKIEIPDDQHGISNREIFVLFQDNSGAIWVGTWGGGLHKLIVPQTESITKAFIDSIKIINYRNNPDDPNTLASDKVKTITQDKNGMLWIGTANGLSLFNPQTNRFIRNFYHNPNNPNSLNSNNISTLLIDYDNIIWIGTWDKGLNRYDPQTDRFTHFRNNPNNPASLVYDKIFILFLDKSGNLWTGTWGGGISFVDPTDNKKGITEFKNYQSNINQKSLSGNFIYDIFQDASGVIWIGTEGNGLSKFDPESNKFELYQLNKGLANLSGDNDVTAVYKDIKNNLWIGTRSNGLINFDPKSGKSKQYLNIPGDPSSLSQNTVRAIVQDFIGNLWIGTDAGINLWEEKTETFTHFTSDPDGPAASNIRYLFVDSKGLVWFGSWGNGVSNIDPRTKEITIYKNDPDNPESISDNIVWTITEDKDGDIWLGTENGLNRFIANKKIFERFYNDPQDSLSISSNKILSSKTISNGDTWFGTMVGINKLIKTNHPDQQIRFNKKTIKNGLFSNTVHGLAEDNNGKLWLANADYLTKYNPSSNSFKGYNVFDALKLGEIQVNALYMDRESDALYVGGSNGIIIFNPENIKTNMHKPNIVITDFKIFTNSVKINEETDGRIILQKSIIQTKQILLQHSDAVISFEFAALHFNAPKRNQYAYRLENFEKKWNYVSSDKRTVTYTNLDPGTYYFRVKASNNDGVWNETGSSLQVIISPPFWNTWWFRILSFALLIYILLSYFKYRTKTITGQNIILENVVKEKTDEMKGLMDKMIRQEKLATIGKISGSIAHELRNPLGAVKQSIYILKKKTADSSQIIKKHIDLIDQELEVAKKVISNLLEMSNISSITKEKIDLKMLLKYILGKTKVNNGTCINYNISDDAQFIWADNIQIEQVFNNLISNSIHAMEENGVITFTAKMTENKKFTRIDMTDNGKGIDPKDKDKIFEPLYTSKAKGTGLGLSICKHIIENHNGKMEVESKLNQGTTVTLLLPTENQIIEE